MTTTKNEPTVLTDLRTLWGEMDKTEWERRRAHLQPDLAKLPGIEAERARVAPLQAELTQWQQDLASEALLRVPGLATDVDLATMWITSALTAIQQCARLVAKVREHFEHFPAQDTDGFATGRIRADIQAAESIFAVESNYRSAKSKYEEIMAAIERKRTNGTLTKLGGRPMDLTPPPERVDAVPPRLAPMHAKGGVTRGGDDA
jgi:hypothetical protein